MKKSHLPLLMAFLLALAASCRQQEEMGPADLMQLPAITEMGVNAVVEIPAGTNRKVEYDKEKKEFRVDQRDGKERVVDFLPYPGNYGFIPSTFMDPAQGGDGDALDILVISEAAPAGTVLEVRPIAALLLLDEGEQDTKIIAVPADSSLQVIRATNFMEFSIDYDGAKHIIESWFLYYDGLGTAQFQGWRDEQFAMQEIRKWAIAGRPAEERTED